MNNINKVNYSAICGNDLNSKVTAAAISPSPSDSIMSTNRRPLNSIALNINQSTTTGSSNNHGFNDITTTIDEWYNKLETLAELSMNHFESCLEDAETAKKEQEAMLNCLAKRTKFDKSINPIPNSIYRSAANKYMKLTSDELDKEKDMSPRRMKIMLDTIQEVQQKPEKLLRTAQHADKEMMKCISKLQIFADDHGYVLPSSMGTNKRVQELCEQVLPANYNNNNNKRNRK